MEDTTATDATQTTSFYTYPVYINSDYLKDIEAHNQRQFAQLRKERAAYQAQIAHLPAEEQAGALREYDDEAGRMAYHSDLPIAGQLDQFLRVWLATDEIFNFDPEEIHAAERHLAAFKQRANAKAAALGEPVPFPDSEPH